MSLINVFSEQHSIVHAILVYFPLISHRSINLFVSVRVRKYQCFVASVPDLSYVKTLFVSRQATIDEKRYRWKRCSRYKVGFSLSGEFNGHQVGN